MRRWITIKDRYGGLPEGASKARGWFTGRATRDQDVRFTEANRVRVSVEHHLVDFDGAIEAVPQRRNESKRAIAN